MTTWNFSHSLEAHWLSRRVFNSVPRKRILLRALQVALASATWLGLMGKLGITGGGAGAVGMFLMTATVALFAMALRSRRRVTLDESGLLLQRGRRQIRIPWHGLTHDKALKFENVLGWQRLNIKALIDGCKITTSINWIFGVGLPALEIYLAVQPWIERARVSAR